MLGHIQRDALGVANAVAAQPAPQGLVHAAGDFVGHSDPQGVTTHQGNLPVKQPVALRPQGLLLRVAQVPHLGHAQQIFLGGCIPLAAAGCTPRQGRFEQQTHVQNAQRAEV